MVTLGWPGCMVDQDQPCCDGTRMASLGWRCSWHYWDSPHWNGSSMVCWDWLHWDSTEIDLLKQWHWDVLTGMVALGLPWDDSTGTNGCTRTALEQPRHKGSGNGLAQMALPGWHQSGLIGTALGWPPKHLCPVPVPTQLPHSGFWGPRPPLLPCWSLGSGEVRTGTPVCGTGALHDGGFGHQCFGEKLLLGVSSTAGQSLKDFSFHALNEEEITQNPEVSMV